MNKKKVKVIDEKTNKTICEYTIDDQTVIQCYSPKWWHNPQAIVMNEKGKQKLLDALQNGKEINVIEAMTTDDEGFYLTVVVKNADEIDKEYVLPYYDEPAKEVAEGKRNPVYDGYVILGKIKENRPYTKKQVEHYIKSLNNNKENQHNR